MWRDNFLAYFPILPCIIIFILDPNFNTISMIISFFLHLTALLQSNCRDLQDPCGKTTSLLATALIINTSYRSKYRIIFWSYFTTSTLRLA